MKITSNKDTIEAYIFRTGRLFGGEVWENSKLVSATTKQTAFEIHKWASEHGAKTLTMQQIAWQSA